MKRTITSLVFVAMLFGFAGTCLGQSIKVEGASPQIGVYKESKTTIRYENILPLKGVAYDMSVSSIQTVLATDDSGLITKLKFDFREHTESKKESILAGKSYIYTVSDEGDVTLQDSEGKEPSDAAEKHLSRLFTEDPGDFGGDWFGLLPETKIKKRQRIVADKEQLEMMSSEREKCTKMTAKLVAVKKQGGVKCAVLEVEKVLEKKLGAVKIRSVVKGKVWIGGVNGWIYKQDLTTKVTGKAKDGEIVISAKKHKVENSDYKYKSD